MTYCTSSVSFIVSCIMVRLIISSLNFSTLLRARAFRLSGISMHAVSSGISSCAAWRANSFTVVSPMARLGTLMMRRTEISSAGLTSTRR